MTRGRRVRRAALERAVSTVEKLRERKGVVGRAARALDDELAFRYLAERVQHEHELIDRYVKARPAGHERVSIVVPVFGIPVAYLKELVESIEKQTYAEWEVCFCDDGDEDQDVKRYLKELTERSPRFRVKTHPTNLGIAPATRTGLRLASGGLVAFADEDDLLHPRALEAVTAAFAADADTDLVYTDNDHATDLGHRRAPVRKPAWSPELLQCVNYVNHLVVARRSFLERCPDLFGTSSSGGQDWELALVAAARARKVALVPLPLYHWRKRPGSIADAAGAKPWVRDACLRVRLRHLRSIDPRLTLSPASADGSHPNHLEPDLDDVDAPRVTVLVLDAEATSTFSAWTPDYGGWTRVKHVSTPGVTTQRELLALLVRELRAVEGDHVLVVDGRRPRPEGSLRRSIAFAIQPGVACVWPFTPGGQRLCYTVKSRRSLAPLEGMRNPFLRFSGNALAGPLHGVVADRHALLAAADVVLDLGAGGFLEQPRNDDSLGAALGLACRQAGYRNVACRGSICAVELSDVSVPEPLVPRRDPYV